jgi:hypothetical protein
MLISPEILEAASRQFGVSDGVLDVSMAEIKLDRACILTGIRQMEPGPVAKHVRMHRKLYARGFPGFGHDVVDRAPRHLISSIRRGPFLTL